MLCEISWFLPCHLRSDLIPVGNRRFCNNLWGFRIGREEVHFLHENVQRGHGRDFECTSNSLTALKVLEELCKNL